MKIEIEVNDSINEVYPDGFDIKGSVFNDPHFPNTIRVFIEPKNSKEPDYKKLYYDLFENINKVIIDERIFNKNIE